MTHAVDGLEPGLLWKHFAALAAIPRGSKNEEAAAQYVLSVAERLGLSAERDSAGNVVIRKGGTAGHEDGPALILQGHLDMVCEKNSSTTHDFNTDPIRMIRNGDWIKADGTTLGADNGIGAAAALAVLESTDLVHGPLECLFTIDEETGMTGAFNLSTTFLHGTRMLNLDTEEEGSVYIGCAGGLDTVARTEVQVEPLPAGFESYTLEVSGLKGGHSGVDIHEGRANALKVLARALDAALEKGAKVASLKGGSKRNALPREASALIALGSEPVEALTADLAQLEADVRAEFGRFDTPVSITLAKAKENTDSAFSDADARRVAAFLRAAPHGVLAWSPDVPNLVQTSTNLAIIETDGNQVMVATSQRSPRTSAKRDAGAMMKAAAILAGFTVEQGAGYPGWAPNPSSPLLAVAKRIHKELFGKEPEIKAIHAGLECGIISEKYPGIDVISFGPTIRNAHSPDEMVSIPSVQGFWSYLSAMLAVI